MAQSSALNLPGTLPTQAESSLGSALLSGDLPVISHDVLIELARPTTKRIPNNVFHPQDKENGIPFPFFFDRAAKIPPYLWVIIASNYFSLLPKEPVVYATDDARYTTFSRPFGWDPYKEQHMTHYSSRLPEVRRQVERRIENRLFTARANLWGSVEWLHFANAGMSLNTLANVIASTGSEFYAQIAN